MNRRKIALALRLLAEAIEEDDAIPANDVPRPPRRRPARPPAVDPQVSEADRARAREALRRNGLAVKG